MAQVDRLYTRYVNVFTVAGNNYITQIRDFSVKRKFEKLNNKAAKDAGIYSVPGQEESEITFSIATEGGAVMLAYAGTRIAFTMKEGPTSLTYSGTGFVQEATHAGSDGGAQTESMSIEVGVLTHA